MGLTQVDLLMTPISLPNTHQLKTPLTMTGEMRGCSETGMRLALPNTDRRDTVDSFDFDDELESRSSDVSLGAELAARAGGIPRSQVDGRLWTRNLLNRLCSLNRLSDSAGASRTSQ